MLRRLGVKARLSSRHIMGQSTLVQSSANSPHHTTALSASLLTRAVCRLCRCVLRLSWFHVNQCLNSDTTKGLVEAIASALCIDLNTPLPPLLPANLHAGELVLQRRMEPLWSLPADRAVCAVSMCGGRLTVNTTARFESVFMSRTTVEAGIVGHGMSPHRVWAR